MARVGLLSVARRAHPAFLFEWDAADLSLTARSGQTIASPPRGSLGWGFGADGRLVQYQNNEPRWMWYGGRVGLLIESQRTNVLPNSENFGAWTLGGVTTRTAAVLACGVASLDLLGDNDVAAAANFGQALALGGTEVKALSLLVAQGSSVSSVVRLYDATASASPLFAVVTWSAGVPVVTMSTGTFLLAIPVANGIYRLLFTTGTVTGANTNTLYVYPAADSGITGGATGTIYAGGAQLEEGYAYPSTYMRTAAGSFTRNAESYAWPIGFTPDTLRQMGGFTLYEEYFVQRPWTVAASTTDCTNIGNSNVGSTNALMCSGPGGSGFAARWNIGGNNVNAVATGAGSPVVLARVERRVWVDATGLVSCGYCLNGGAEATGAGGSASGWSGSFASQILQLGDNAATPSRFGDRIQLRARLAYGVRSLAFMQQGGGQ